VWLSPWNVAVIPPEVPVTTGWGRGAIAALADVVVPVVELDPEPDFEPLDPLDPPAVPWDDEPEPEPLWDPDDPLEELCELEPERDFDELDFEPLDVEPEPDFDDAELVCFEAALDVDLLAPDFDAPARGCFLLDACAGAWRLPLPWCRPW
jgi:hypothetical protein